jgi:hypothetical protein
MAKKWLGMSKGGYGLLSCLCLLMGMGIYLFFRDLNMVIFNWIPKPAMLDMAFIPIAPSTLASIWLYNAPDTLWFLSGIWFLRFLWFADRKWQGVYIVCFYVIALIIETSQLSKTIPGTFDILDVLFMGITALVEGLLYTHWVKRSLG